MKKETSFYLPSGEREPSDDTPRWRLCGWRWSGRISLSSAIVFHSCLRFLAFLTFFTSCLTALLSMLRFCSWNHERCWKKWTDSPNKREIITVSAAESPSASVSLSFSPLCPEAFSPSTVQRSMKGLSRTSLHRWNLVCVINTNMKLILDKNFQQENDSSHVVCCFTCMQWGC